MKLYKKLIGHVPMVYAGETAIAAAAIVGATSAVAGAGYSVYAGKQAANAAADSARAEKQKIQKQEALIAEEQRKQDALAKEREDRMGQRELLSDSEEGVTSLLV